MYATHTVCKYARFIASTKINLLCINICTFCNYDEKSLNYLPTINDPCRYVLTFMDSLPFRHQWFPRGINFFRHLRKKYIYLPLIKNDMVWSRHAIKTSTIFYGYYSNDRHIFPQECSLSPCPYLSMHALDVIIKMQWLPPRALRIVPKQRSPSRVRNIGLGWSGMRGWGRFIFTKARYRSINNGRGWHKCHRGIGWYDF